MWLTLFRFVIFVEATLLLAAAGLKGWLLATDSFADIRTGYSFNILVLAVIVEVTASTYLFFGRDRAFKWLILAILFSVFFVVSGVRYLLGISGCGCLGAVELPRWILPLNDIAVLCFLIVFSRKWSCGGSTILTKLRERAATCIANPCNAGTIFGAALMIGGFIAFPYLQSAAVMVNMLHMPPLNPVRYSAGNLNVGEQVEVAVPWTNASSHKIEVLGSQSSCACIGLTRSRISAEASQQIELTINVCPHEPGFFHQRIVCFVDHPNQDRFTEDVVANAVVAQSHFLEKEN